MSGGFVDVYGRRGQRRWCGGGGGCRVGGRGGRPHRGGQNGVGGRGGWWKTGCVVVVYVVRTLHRSAIGVAQKTVEHGVECRANATKNNTGRCLPS